MNVTSIFTVGFFEMLDMVLIYAISDNVIIASNYIIEKGTVKLISRENRSSETFPVTHTNFKKIQVRKAGKYTVTLETEKEVYKKEITISK